MLIDIRELGWCPVEVLLRSTVLVERRSPCICKCLSLVGALQVLYWHPRAFPDHHGGISHKRCFTRVVTEIIVQLIGAYLNNKSIFFWPSIFWGNETDSFKKYLLKILCEMLF